MAEAQKNTIITIFCNTCVREMKHSLLSSVKRSGVDELSHDFTIRWENTYQVLECQQCNNVTLRVRQWDDESQSYHYNRFYHDTYYPPIVSRPKPIWFAQLEPKFQEVLKEVYIALDANARFLAAFGARTALDMLVVDKIGDVGSFKAKLKKLESEGYVNPTEKELLDAVTEAGNAAAHRGYAPDGELLTSVMDILESLFDRIYFKPSRDKDLLRKARELKRKLPQRNDTSKKCVSETKQLNDVADAIQHSQRKPLGSNEHVQK